MRWQEAPGGRPLEKGVWVGKQAVICKCSHLFEATCEVREPASLSQSLPSSAICPKCSRVNQVPVENWELRPLAPGEYTYRSYAMQVVGFIVVLIVLFLISYACSLIRGL